MGITLRVRKFFRTDLAVCSLVYCVLFLVFFRANWAFTIRRLADENSYLGWVDAVLGGFFWVDPLSPPWNRIIYAPGASIAFLPAGLVARISELFFPIDPVAWRWAVTALFSSSLWILCFFFILKISEELAFIPKRRPGETRDIRSFLSAMLILACTQIFHSAFQRPLMSHMVELSGVLGAAYFALQNRFRLAFALSAYVTLTRYNDLPIFLVVAGRYFDVYPEKWAAFRSARIVRQWPVLFAFSFGLFAWVGYVAFVKGYGGYRLGDLVLTFTPWDVYRFLLAPDWGLIWLLPFWWVAFLIAIANFRRFSWAGRASVVWMAIEGLLCTVWGSNGGAFGFRYLIGSSLGAILIWSEAIRLNLIRADRFRIVTALNGIWILFLTFVFWSVEYKTFFDNPTFLYDALKIFGEPTFFAESIGRSPLWTLDFFSMSSRLPNTSLWKRGDFVDLRYEGCIVLAIAVALILAFIAVFTYTRLTEGKRKNVS